SYAEGIHDEFVVPAVNSAVKKKICDHDSVIFCNFRPDRASQLAGSLTNKDYHFFHKGHHIEGLVFVSMMVYSEHVKGLVAFEKDRLKYVFGEVIAKNDLKQL